MGALGRVRGLKQCRELESELTQEMQKCCQATRRTQASSKHNNSNTATHPGVGGLHAAVARNQVGTRGRKLVRLTRGLGLTVSSSKMTLGSAVIINRYILLSLFLQFPSKVSIFLHTYRSSPKFRLTSHLTSVIATASLRFRLGIQSQYFKTVK